MPLPIDLYSPEEKATLEILLTVLKKWRDKPGTTFNYIELKKAAKEIGEPKHIPIRLNVINEMISTLVEEGLVYKHSGFGRGRNIHRYAFTEHLMPGEKPPTFMERKARALGIPLIDATKKKHGATITPREAIAIIKMVLERIQEDQESAPEEETDEHTEEESSDDE